MSTVLRDRTLHEEEGRMFQDEIRCAVMYVIQAHLGAASSEALGWGWGAALVSPIAWIKDRTQPYRRSG